MRKLAKTTIAVVAAMSVALICMRRFGGQLLSSQESPTGTSMAEIRLNHSLSALDADYLSVRLLPRRVGMPTEVFGASTYGGRVHVRWNDGSTLVVVVQHASELQIFRKADAWRNVTVKYEEIP